MSATATSSAAGALSTWTAHFTTSSSGDLEGAAGSTISVTLPTGTTLGSFAGGTVVDSTADQTVGSNCSVASGTTVSCLIYNGYSVPAGDALTVTLNGVTNPTATGPATVSVSTTSDTMAASTSTSITTDRSVAALSATPSSTSAGAPATWTVGFTTSSSGDLEGAAGSIISVTLPTGTTLGSFAGGTVFDTTANATVGSDCSVASGTTVTCLIYNGYSVPAGDALTVTLNGVTNPTATGPATVSVSTSSDTTPASASISITTAQSVASLSATASSSAAGALSTWTIGFTASSSGALEGTAGSSISVTLPAGTNMGSFVGGTVTDVTTGQIVSYPYYYYDYYGCTVASGTTVTCDVYSGYTVNAGDVVSVLLYGVTNPTTTGPATVSVSTTSDTVAASTSTSITTHRSVTSLSATASSSAAGALSTWTAHFTTSSSGDLEGAAGSTISVTLPTGTTLGSFAGGTVVDSTADQTVGSNCSVASGTTVSCLIYNGYSVPAGDALTVTLNGVTNPTATGPATVSVSTTSDTVAASTSTSITTDRSVAALSATPSSTSAGAPATWTVGFTTSSSGDLEGAAGSIISVTLPTGTTLGSFAGGTVFDTTANATVGSDCSVASGTTVTCLIYNGYSVPAGDALTVTLNGVTNPTATGPATVSVSTSSDTTPASASISITTAQSVASLSATASSSAAGALSTWTIGFTASSSGALEGTAGSSISVTLPAGTNMGSFVGGTVTDVTTGQIVSYPYYYYDYYGCTVASGTTVTCDVYSGYTVNAGDVVSVLLYGVTNPTTTGPATVSVSTTSDTVAASTSTSITTHRSVTSLSATASSSAAGALSTWTIGFTASSSGALEGSAGSAITITLPTGTNMGSFAGGTVTDVTTGQTVGSNCTLLSGTTVSCPVYYYDSVPAGDALTVTLNGVTNPTATGSATVSVSTTSDTVAASTSTSITTDRSVAALSATPSSTSAGAPATWTVGFTTSSSGDLEGAAGSIISVTLPTGTTLGSFAGGTVFDTTANATVGSDCSVASGTTVTCLIYNGYSVPAGDALTVTLNGVTNPTATGPATVSVSTSSDTTPASASISITTAQSVASLSATASSSAAGALSTWTIGFTASSSGALEGTAGSSISVTLPAGTNMGSFVGGTVTDVTTGQIVSYPYYYYDYYGCTVASGTTVTCDVYSGYTVNAGDVVSVLLYGVTNPTTTGPATVSVSTTSDTVAASTSTSITTHRSVTSLSATASSSAAGALSTWTAHFTTSSSGDLEGAAGSTISVTLPTGTTLGSFAGGTVVDSTADQTVGSNCSVASGTTVSCLIYNGYSVPAGDALTVTLNGVTNPTATGSATVSVSTTSDTVAASTSTSITTDRSVAALTVKPSSSAVGALTTWTVGFTTSSSGDLEGAAGSIISVTLPTGTTLGSFAGGTVFDTTANATVGSNCSVASGTTVTCLIYNGYSVPAGDGVTVSIAGVTNPTTTGSTTTRVVTSSDTTSVTAAASLTSAQSVKSLSVTPSYSVAGAITTWTIGFTASSSGNLEGTAGSTITATLPAGTSMGSFSGGDVADSTTDQTVGSGCTVTGGTTVSCAIYGGDSIRAGDVVSISLNRVTNPTTTGPATVSVSTSSDTKSATASTTITPAVLPIVSEVDPSTGFTTGGTPVTITGSGFTGATEVDFNGTAAGNVMVVNDDSITATSPVGVAGVVDVTVTTPVGSSTVTPADQFTYTVFQTTPQTVPCSPDCTNSESSALDATSITVTGDSGTSSSGPSTSLTVNTDELSCGASQANDYDYSTVVSTLSAQGFVHNAALTVTEVVGNEPSTAGVQVCYGTGQNPTKGAFLSHCKHSMKAPCLESLTESGGSVVAKFLAPPTDPRFWTGDAAPDLTSFSPATGAPDSVLTIKGKNLSGVVSVAIGGARASISSKSTAAKLEVTLSPNTAVGTTYLTVTSASGETVSSKLFTVT